MPSLYETTAIVGDVSSSNFTTLYNSSGLSAPNAGGGAVGGNLNVSGNLTVQGTSLLNGAVTLGSTLSLPNYTFPTPDGTTYQVLATDGSGNLYWTNVSAIPGASYSIQADSTTGGANLTLVDSGGGMDSVKFAGSGGITVSQTDSSTITINGADPLPAGTKGDVLYYDGTDWVAENTIQADTSAQRLTVQYNNSTAGPGSPLLVVKNFGATNYTTGSGTTVNFGVVSNSQAASRYAIVGATYSATDPAFIVQTSIDNFATAGLNVITANGTSLSLAGTSVVFDVDGSNKSISLATDTFTINGNISTPYEYLTINSDGDAFDSFVYLKGSTQYLKWNNASDQFELSNDLYVSGDISATGQNINVNVDNTASDAYVNFGTSTGVKYLKWDTTGTDPNFTLGPQFELNGNLYIDNTQPYITFKSQPDGVNNLYGVRGSSSLDDPWFVGAGSTGDDDGYMVIATGDNSATPGDASPIYVRQYAGAGGGTVPWYGGSAAVVTELTLLDGNGNTDIPNNLTVGGNVDVDTITIDGVAAIDTTITTTTSTTTVMIAQTVRDVLKAVVHIEDTVSGASHAVEALVLRTGATAKMTTYGEIYSAAALASFTADVSAGYIRMLATPASSNNTTFTVVRISLD